MKSRIKLQLPLIETREEAESILGEIALTTINKQKLTAAMDSDLATVRQRYESSIAACDQDLKLKTEQLCAWAQSHRSEFPKDRKSIDFVHGSLGFRKGTPEVMVLSRAWTWAKVLAMITLLRWRKFIRIKREVNKEAILQRAAAAKSPEKFATLLARIGVKVVQEESFFVDPKLTPVETRQVTEA